MTQRSTRQRSHSTWRVARAVAAAVILAATAAAASVAADPWIAQRARMALLLSPEVDASELHVDSTNGHVTLFGSVGSDAGRGAAERIVRQIIGVRSVRNLLAVLPPTDRPATAVADATVAENVGLALRQDPALQAADIHVASVDAGTVVLGGHASSLSEELDALRVARAVAGVRRVASVIEGPEVLSDAEFWGDAAQARSSATADARLATAVKVRLLTDARLPPQAVAVDAEDGTVTLFGVVPDEASRRVAEQVAAAVPGVRQVRNQLLVRRTATTAPGPLANVRAAVAAALDDAPALDDAAIEVAVIGDTVQLSGRVATQADHLTALAVTREAAPGVTVVDALSVAPATPGSAASSAAATPVTSAAATAAAGHRPDR